MKSDYNPADWYFRLEEAERQRQARIERIHLATMMACDDLLASHRHFKQLAKWKSEQGFIIAIPSNMTLDLHVPRPW